MKNTTHNLTLKQQSMIFYAMCGCSAAECTSGKLLDKYREIFESVIHATRKSVETEKQIDPQKR